MFHRSKLSAAALTALGGAMVVLSSTAVAQNAQRVEITGSAIKRTTAEGPAPVEVITKKDIERTGATSINELLRSLASVDIFDQGELASNSPAGSGTASIRLRGLSESDLLVLVNGRRVPINALYDSSGAGAAFDINSLPIGAIERIDIMKDGGSAIYGADAVAGVINFITKTDYQGVEVTGSYGTSSRSDGKETRLGASAGFGDLAKDGWNVLLGLDVFKRDPILRKDREISKSVDFRRYGAGDGRSGFSPYGNVIDPITGAFVGLPYTTCPTENLRAGVCRYDFNASLLTAYNAADRVSAMGLGTLRLGADIRAFAEVIASTSKNTFLAHPVPDYFIVPITDAAQRPYEIKDAQGVGTNQVYIAGRFMQGGPRTTERKSDFFNAATGVEGFTAGLDWKVSVSHGFSKVTNNDSNYFDATKWAAATTSGSLDPTKTTNSATLVDGLKVRPVRVGKSELTTFSAQVSGDLFKLPGGVSKYAVGINSNRETLEDTPDALTQAGQVVGSIQQSAVSASRTYNAVYGELQLPLLKDLEGQIALRYDSYPNNVSRSSPKIGLKYTPIPALALRGSYSESFRAPVLKQLYGAQEEGAITITTPSQCTALGVPLATDGTCLLNAYQVNGSNANLKPETAKTFNLGLVFDDGGLFSSSIDWWKIEKSDDISSPTISSAINAGLFAKIGPRYYIYTNLQNIAQREVSGTDVEARLRFKGTALGNVTVRNMFTYFDTVKTRSSATSDWAEYNATYRYPRWRNTLTVRSEFGPWDLSGAWRSVAGFADTDLPQPVAAGTRRVGTHEELDLSGRYSGFKGWELSFTVKNALDRMPPLSLTNALDNTYTQMGFAELYTARGRYFQLGAKYTFR
ncbi:MAG: TonB-dependent receptor [Burkholderiaceae bacterium]|nr:TonB-dependent receptor [Burkholderiaceae bacterium]